MPGSLEPDEVRDNHVAVMGEALGTVYHKLWNSCVWIHLRWADFNELFGTSSERIELLNAAAGSFFWQVQTSLGNDMLLHLTRLTDPPRTRIGTRIAENLTLQRLPELVAPTIRPKVEELLDDVKRQCAFARDWRNRHLAHDDLPLALGDPTARRLTPASRKRVTDALTAIVVLMNHVHGHYHNSQVVYDAPHRPGSAVSLLHVIRDGLEAQAAQRRRIQERAYLPEDLRPRRPV